MENKIIQIQINKLKQFISQIELNEQLNFNKHSKSKKNKCYEIIGLLKRLSNKLPCDTLLRIYKSFTGSHLDYGDTVHNTSDE